jgi:hypothetical protein
MFNVIYRWKIHPGKEEQFKEAWIEATRLIREFRGGQGSRLHRCEDGSFLAYAQWPDQETWQRSSEVTLPDNSAFVRMKDAVASSEPPIPMTALENLLI